MALYTPAERRRRWAQKHPERAKAVKQRYYERKGRQKRKELHLLKAYGLTGEAFAMLLARQGSRCAVCRTDKPNAHGWCVDHHHATGKVRGVLCHSCNSAIGHLKEDPLVFAAAVRYLEQFHAS